MHRFLGFVTGAVGLLALLLHAPRQPVQASGPEGPVQVVESTAAYLVVRVALPELMLDTVRMADEEDYQVITLPGAGTVEAGRPNVPALGNWILIPNGTDVHLEVDPGEPIVFDDILLQPVQAGRADVDDAPGPDFAKDDETYATDADYPGVLAFLEPRRTQRGQDVAVLWLLPYQHNPQGRTLTIYPDLHVTLFFEGDPQPIPLPLKDEDSEDGLRLMALNAEAVLEAEEEARTEAAPLPPVAYGWDYLIIADPAFAQAANKLAAWKNQLGFKTLVTLVPSAWPQSKVASYLRKGLHSAYHTWQTVPQYVLLIGDAELIPPHYVSWHSWNAVQYQGQTNTQGYIGTDHYYTTLDGADPSDLLADFGADLYIGRLSVETPSQAMARVNGIINYEKSPPSDSAFYSRVVLATQFEDGGEYKLKVGGTIKTVTKPINGIEDRRFTQTTEDIGIFLGGSPQLKSVMRIYYAESAVSPAQWNDDKQYPQEFKNFPGPTTSVGGSIPAYLHRPGFLWDGSAAQVTGAVNAGSFLVTHRGHGGRQHWSQPNFTGPDAVLVDNLGLLPVVWSFNCQTGWFDNETDFQKGSSLADLTKSWEEGFSEHWERPLRSVLGGDYGAVGIVAPTRVSFSGFNDHMMLGMADAIWPTFLGSAGQSGSGSELRMARVLDLGKSYMDAQYKAMVGLTAVQEQEEYELFHWFGDPSMSIRTEEPRLLLIQHTPTWPWLLYPRDMTINVQWVDETATQAGPAEGATVVVHRAGSLSDYWVGTTDVEGNVTFPSLVTSELGEYEILASAENGVPVSGTIEAVPGSAGGVQLGAPVYPCFSELEVLAADAHLAGAGEIEVLITSDLGDEEGVVLVEVGDGLFHGAVPSEPGEEAVSDGFLQVTHGSLIAVWYYDEDDGLDASGWVSDTAAIDCQAPAFEGLASARTGLGCAELEWGAGLDPSGSVTYNIYRAEGAGPVSGEAMANTWALFYPDCDVGQGRTYTYLVRAVDAVGNEDENPVELTVSIHGIFLPLLMRE